MLYNIDEINKPGSYIKANGIYYPGAIRSIKKSPDRFQALWEAITNALESINDNYSSSSYVHIRFFYTTDLIGSRILEKIEIEDNGPGFTDTNFELAIISASAFTPENGFAQSLWNCILRYKQFQNHERNKPLIL